MSWDGDANYREAFVNIVDPDQMGASFVEEMVKQIGDKGDVAIITSNFAATNQVRRIEGIKKTIADKYPGLNIVAILPSEEDQQLAFKAAQDIMKSYPTVKGIWAVTTVAFPGAAEAVKQAGKVGQIAVVGNTQPVHIRSYIKEGACQVDRHVQSHRLRLPDRLRGASPRGGRAAGRQALQGRVSGGIHARERQCERFDHPWAAEVFDFKNIDLLEAQF